MGARHAGDAPVICPGTTGEPVAEEAALTGSPIRTPWGMQCRANMLEDILATRYREFLPHRHTRLHPLEDGRCGRLTKLHRGREHSRVAEDGPAMWGWNLLSMVSP